MNDMHLPKTETEAADIIRTHADAHRGLAIFGGNTRSGFGNRVEAEASLSSRAITGIVAYNPAEMVMTVKAGTPVAEIEAALSAANQMICFEPMDHRAVMGMAGEPTIGGIFAANVSGPRRYVAGAARDSLLGIRFVNGRGEAIKAGGRVMKNVTGLDLVKLLAGSYGTLGFITEVTFRVLPVPPAQTTLVISGLEDETATHAMAAAMATSVEVSGAAHLPESVKSRFLNGSLPDGAATVLRLEGLSASVKVRSQKLQTILSALGPSTFLDQKESQSLWHEIRDVTPYSANPDKPLWRVSVAPSQGHKLVAALRLEAGIDAFYDWQGGLVWMQMDAQPESELLRHYVKAVGGGHATLIRSEVREGIAAFEPLSPAEALLSGRVRGKLDPAGIFNPGKMGTS